jgi:NAD(P)-dependent dehydrogenase (short-subunit alcohol dehydrogenase family)
VRTEGNGKVALVVGGGTGIGYASAYRLAGRNVSVVLSGRRAPVLLQAQQRIVDAHNGAAVEIVAGDAGIEAESQTMVDAAVEYFGRIDILVGAAGVYEPIDFPDIDARSWRRTLTATLDAVTFPAIHAVREMKKTGGGRIVLVSSIAAVVSDPRVAHYNAAKAAVGAVVRSIVLDCTADGIQANAVAPGLVHTPMAEDYIESAAPGMMARVNPLGRPGEADEIGNVVEYLALDAPQFLTGSSVVVDGGTTAGVPLG